MLKFKQIFSYFALISLIFTSPALAIELQVAIHSSVVSFEKSKSESRELEDTDTVFPSISIGGEVDENIFLMLEFASFNYKVKSFIISSSGDKLHIANNEISARTTALILVRRFEKIDLRIGYGNVKQETNLNFNSDGEILSALAGFPNPEIRLDEETGTQFILGINFKIGKSIFLGIEYREITMKPNSRVFSNGVQLSSGERDYSNSMTGLKLGIRF